MPVLNRLGLLVQLMFGTARRSVRSGLTGQHRDRRGRQNHTEDCQGRTDACQNHDSPNLQPEGAKPGPTHDLTTLIG